MQRGQHLWLNCITHINSASAPDPDLHREQQIYLVNAGWNASLNFPCTPKWQRNMRTLHGEPICILHQQGCHSLKDLQMSWSDYKPDLLWWLLCFCVAYCITWVSFLAFSPAWKIIQKQQGSSKCLFCLQVVSMLLYDLVPRGLNCTVCQQMNFRSMKAFFEKCKTDTSWPKCSIKYSINGYCKIPKYFYCIHQFVTRKLYPISRIIENYLEHFILSLQKSSMVDVPDTISKEMEIHHKHCT